MKISNLNKPAALTIMIIRFGDGYDPFVRDINKFTPEYLRVFIYSFKTITLKIVTFVFFLIRVAIFYFAF